MAELNLEDVLAIVLKNPPGIDTQQAMINAAETLIANGMNKEQAIEFVFGHVLSNNKSS
ncbi:hypothetical protein P2G88_18235 [Aliiglaciecola sp. CAU 1673]|uniref:hypothetical protein n=1 Tax=Aliiglaciecola sp. CAU 1673 TaxID=3032595 RepID=UPI0023DC1FA0|nr:hypothetical protein [Aliiglaciecola sp. CAU 1673]MDF2180198.1 hypothetical protein [Aliiglaciecola sp. CAU 1673]